MFQIIAGALVYSVVQILRLEWFISIGIVQQLFALVVLVQLQIHTFLHQMEQKFVQDVILLALNVASLKQTFIVKIIAHQNIIGCSHILAQNMHVTFVMILLIALLTQQIRVLAPVVQIHYMTILAIQLVQRVLSIRVVLVMHVPVVNPACLLPILGVEQLQLV